MATQKYNKSEIMKEAHKIYRECKIYGRTFGSCLKQAWGSAKAMVQLAEKRAAFAKELAERSHAVRLTHNTYLQPIITQYFIDNKSEIWLLFLIAHSKR